MSAAVRTDRDLRVGELLDLLGSFVTFRAFVLVEGHGVTVPVMNCGSAVGETSFYL